MKKIVVLGAGESGVGAAILARKKGYDVFVSDNGTIQKKYKDVLCHSDLKWEEGKHSEELLLDADEVIKSPGIPDNTGVITKLKAKGTSVISEIEFAWRHTNAKIIAITGSNGKTTTTLLTYHILKKAGYNAGLAGNVGNSFAMQVAENDYDYYVLELSSFQLDGIEKFKPDVAVLLNITPDHLDRYEHRLELYTESKFRIIKNLTEKDAFVYCIDDDIIAQEISKRKIKAKLFPFSISKKIKQGACLTTPLTNEGTQPDAANNQLIISNNNQNEAIMYIQELALQGKHNIFNSMASAIAVRLFDIRKDVIRESLSDFKNIEHRLEFALMVHGIEFINDSKATNVNSAWYALESMTKPVIWIAGGRDKGNDYSSLKELVKEKVKAIICLGEGEEKLRHAFSSKVSNIVHARSMTDAVKSAYEIGTKGDVVLLSPACASFDLFKNYEDRGRQFKQSVREL